MTGRMVFVPLDHAEVLALRDGRELERTLSGHAATVALLQAHDFDQTMVEDGEFAALTYAGVRAAVAGHDPRRLVVAAEVPAGECDEPAGDPYGTVVLRRLGWSDVRALFADEEGAETDIAQAREATAGLDFDDAVALDALDTLLDQHDLLWFDPAELDQLV